MILTFIGVIELVLGLGLFLFGSLNALFMLTMMATLFGGGAALYLPALGGSSVTPATFSLIFLVPRIFAPGTSQFTTMIEAVKANRWLVVFVLYAALAAYVMPRLFADQFDVTPMGGLARTKFASATAFIIATERLRPTAQNITTSVYLVGTLMVSIASYTVLSRAGNGRLLVRAAGILGIVSAVLGLASVFFKNTPVDAFMDLFRNGAYAQLDQQYKGFARMRGLWPEASSFANVALVWFVFNFECWLRRVQSGWTGTAALLLGIALLLSTSSTAYLGLGAFSVIVMIRALVSPGLISGDRLAWLAVGVLGLVAITASVMLFQPKFANEFVDLVEYMTVGKADSFSGRQRRFWAEQGLFLFRNTFGLGVGPGSFRSSSLATAILGSTGIIGTLAFLLHMLRAIGPLRLSTYIRVQSENLNIAAASAWAFAVSFLALSISSASCDPGIEIAILGGAAIALRGLKSLPQEVKDQSAPDARTELVLRTPADPAPHNS